MSKILNDFSETLRIFIPDPVVEDRIYPISQTKHDELVQRFELNRGAKKGLDLYAMRELLGELSGQTPRLARGGSGSTMAFTIKGLFPHVDILFAGVVGDTDYSDTIRASFQKAGIGLFPPILPPKIPAQLAITCMLLPEGGGRTIATYPGTFGKIIKPDILTEELIRSRDVIHLPLTNGEEERLGKDFVNRLLMLGRDLGKILWLNLPTHKDFAEKNRGYFQKIIPGADLLLGNIDELKWVYGTTDNQTALKRLQRTFRQNPYGSNGRLQGHPEKAAFITNDKYKAYVITASQIIPVPAKPVREEEIVNNGGAGDTALAGFIAAYFIRGLPPEMAARIGHALAAQKLRQFEPCLAAPPESLEEEEPALARALLGPRQPKVIEARRFARA